jgi:hypothetical protein
VGDTCACVLAVGAALVPVHKLRHGVEEKGQRLRHGLENLNLNLNFLFKVHGLEKKLKGYDMGLRRKVKGCFTKVTNVGQSL